MRRWKPVDRACWRPSSETVGLSEPLPARTSIASTWAAPVLRDRGAPVGHDLGWIHLGRRRADPLGPTTLRRSPPRFRRLRVIGSTRSPRRACYGGASTRRSTGTAANGRTGSSAARGRLRAAGPGLPGDVPASGHRLLSGRSPTRSSRTTSPGNPVDAPPGAGAGAVAGQPAGDGQLASAHGPGRHRHAAKLRRGRVIRPRHRRRMAGVRRSAPPEGEMDPTEVRRRATAGALLIAGRTAITQMIALAGNIVLARLLVPDDFGAVAFGATLVTVATFFSDGGMGVALIRRRDDRIPTTCGAARVPAGDEQRAGGGGGRYRRILRPGRPGHWGDGPLDSRSRLRARRRRSCSSAACATGPSSSPNSWNRWSTTRGRSRSSSLASAYGGSRPGRSSAAPWPPCCSSASPRAAGSGSVRLQPAACAARIRRTLPGPGLGGAPPRPGPQPGDRRGGRDLRARAVVAGGRAMQVRSSSSQRSFALISRYGLG